MANLFLYGYLPFLVLCLLAAVYWQWISKADKHQMGALISVVLGFIPIANIYWVILGVAEILGLPEFKHHWIKKFERMILMVGMIVWACVLFVIEWGLTKWQLLKRKFTN